jgi:hypothetical protein
MGKRSFRNSCRLISFITFLDGYQCINWAGRLKGGEGKKGVDQPKIWLWTVEWFNIFNGNLPILHGHARPLLIRIHFEKGNADVPLWSPPLPFPLPVEETE